MQIANYVVEAGDIQMGVDLGGLNARVTQQLLQPVRGDPLGLESPAATAASLISSRAAWLVSTLAPLRAGWNRL